MLVAAAWGLPVRRADKASGHSANGAANRPDPAGGAARILAAPRGRNFKSLRGISPWRPRKSSAGIWLAPTSWGSVGLITRSSAGYTLVEMALVVLILGIISVMATNKLQPALQHAKVNSAAATVAADMQYAQLVAARQRKPVLLLVDQALKEYLIRDRDNATVVFRIRYLGADTDYGIDSLGADVSSMEIFASGVTRQNATFTVGLNGYTRQVRFTRAGQIRVLNGS